MLAYIGCQDNVGCRIMLNSNGRHSKQRNSYHMSQKELIELLRYLGKHCDPKWGLFVLLQFSLGLRCGEAAAIQLQDFSDNYKVLRYRQEKSNRIIVDPIPIPVRKLLKGYISLNMHRFVDGYIFPRYKSCKSPHYTSEVIGSMWSKWRKGCAKEFHKPAWLDRYETARPRCRILEALNRKIYDRKLLARESNIPREHIRIYLAKLREQGFITKDMLITESGYMIMQAQEKQIKYRISSHSLRRLHRTLLRKDMLKDGYTEYIVAQVCNYQDFNCYLRYINQYEYTEKKEEIILPYMDPITAKITGLARGQKQISDF